MIAAYCCQSWRISTWRTTGVWPLTSPPLYAETLDINRLIAPVVYLRLHGLEGQPYLYGDPGKATALSAEQVREADFQGSLVFLEGCYGLEMAQAFLDAGAVAAVGCSEPTWGRSWRLGPSSLVGREWLRHVKAGLDADGALNLALSEVPDRYNDGWSVIGNKMARLNAPGDTV